jgi:hypothetical protein
MKTRNEVVALVRAKIRLLHFAYSTEVSYCGWVARYYDFCRALPPKLTHEEKAEAFLTHLALRQQVAAKTQNQAFAALLFLYEHVLNQPLAGADAVTESAGHATGADQDRAGGGCPLAGARSHRRGAVS